ncbi:hypothetical protein DFH28DRAFT_946355 [Melampsora americana]|nr:hypothetical protein DFH28DRAFT_946355 [Melampsora americana]
MSVIENPSAKSFHSPLTTMSLNSKVTLERLQGREKYAEKTFTTTSTFQKMTPCVNPTRTQVPSPQVRSVSNCLGELPTELILNIIHHFTCEADLGLSGQKNRLAAKHSSIDTIKRLRLVNKRFSEISRSKLFQSVKIENDLQGRDFVKWYQSLQPNHRPRVSRLSVAKIHAGFIDRRSTSFKVFEQVITMLAPGLIQLQVEFLDCFMFSSTVVKNLARCSSLTTLHLKVATQQPCDAIQSSQKLGNQLVHSAQYSLDSLLDALHALPNLISLDLNNCLDRCPVLLSANTHPRLPSIVRLSANLQNGQTAFRRDQHISLCTLADALKSSLKHLVIRGSRYESERLVPVLEAVSANLQTLQLSETSVVNHCPQLEFPKLRTISLDDSRFPQVHQFSSPLFQSASTLIFRTWNSGLDTNDAPLEIPDDTLAHLRQVILTHTSKPTKATVQLYKACSKNNVDLFLMDRSMDVVF